MQIVEGGEVEMRSWLVVPWCLSYYYFMVASSYAYYNHKYAQHEQHGNPLGSGFWVLGSGFWFKLEHSSVSNKSM